MILAPSILFPLLAALVVGIFRKANRPLLLVLTALLQSLVSALLASVVLLPETALTLFHASDKIEIAFRSDGTAKFFCTLVAIGWLFVILYSFVAMQREKNEPGFYICMFLSEAAVIGAALSTSLVTMFVFCELLTVCSIPLVLHNGSCASKRSAIKYLFYSVSGALLVLFGIFALAGIASTFSFTVGGVGLEALPLTLLALFCLVLGFGMRAGLYPLHGWLISASPNAPAPASALLSGLITKVGVLAIVRVLYFIAGPALLKETWVQTALIVLALISILIGATLAYSEKLLKKRLAYLTVSRVSYALIGIFLFTADGLKGAFLQIASHTAAQTALLLFAGAVVYLTGETETSALCGIRKRMPVTTLSFTVAALSMIGMPPTGGFLSTWTLASAALEGIPSPLSYIIPAVLILSALLTAGALLSVSVRAFYPGDKINPAFIESQTKKEPLLLVLPTVLLAASTVLLGLPAGMTSAIADLIVGTIL